MNLAWLSTKAVALFLSPPLYSLSLSPRVSSSVHPHRSCLPDYPELPSTLSLLNLEIINMDLINWSLNAIDQIYSTRKGGSGEPACPDGSYPAGYVMDSYGKFQLLCLANLTIEDVEDVYLTILMITGHLLIGMGIALVYRKICKTGGPETSRDAN